MEMRSPNSAARGLFQKVEGGTYYVRRVIPRKLRPLFPGKTGKPRHSFLASTGTTDDRVARDVAQRLLRIWDAEIEAARALGSGPVASLPAILSAIENWRYARCAVAAGFAAEVADAEARKFRATVPDIAGRGVAAIYGLPHDAPAAVERGPLHSDAVAWARAYFQAERNLGKDRGLGLPYGAGTLLGRLQVAAREAGGWAAVPDFDSTLDAAVEGGGPVGRIPPSVREGARLPFARAWLEVCQQEEAERRRAAAILAALDVAGTRPESIRAEPRRDPEFAPREGDLTVAEVIEEFKRTRAKPEEAKLVDKQYGHIFRALKEIIGEDKPMRAFGRSEFRDVHRFLCTLPSNASKIYPGVPLAEAAERAESDGRKLVKPNTVRSYLISLSGLCRFAVAEGYMTVNPCEKQIPSKQDMTQRRGFTKDELEKVFGALAEERAADSARWWVPAVLAWTGARANEIAQLHLEDIKERDGVAYIDLGLFDADGRRLERRRLKNETSARAIPIHSELVKAGFLEFARRRREAGEERLFPDLYPNSLGYYSHELSKHFGRLCDRVDLTEEAVCLHSLRHGFKDSGDEVRLPEYILEALGGWGSGGSHMRKYGGRCSPERVKANAEHIELITLGGFSLGPPPAALKPEARVAADAGSLAGRGSGFECGPLARSG